MSLRLHKSYYRLSNQTGDTHVNQMESRKPEGDGFNCVDGPGVPVVQHVYITVESIVIESITAKRCICRA